MLQRAVCFFKDSKLLLLANIDSIGSGTVSVGKILLFHIYDIYCWRLLKGAFSLILHSKHSIVNRILTFSVKDCALVNAVSFRIRLNSSST